MILRPVRKFLLLSLLLPLALQAETGAPPEAEAGFLQLVDDTGVALGDSAMRDAPRWRPPRIVLVRGTEDTVADLA
ncbi:MAG: hypothetical protein AAGE85_09275, partial [Pseudomonadota bacterium]